MGSLDEFSPKLRAYLQVYPWRRLNPIPITPLAKPLSECNLALVSSASFSLPHQAPFVSTLTGGDPSFREIPASVSIGELAESHPSSSFDHKPMRSDPNLAFPIDRINELAKAGVIGSVNHRHLSFQGNISATGKLTKHTAPEAAAKFVADGVDIALLVPV